MYTGTVLYNLRVESETYTYCKATKKITGAEISESSTKVGFALHIVKYSEGR